MQFWSFPGCSGLSLSLWPQYPYWAIWKIDNGRKMVGKWCETAETGRKKNRPIPTTTTCLSLSLAPKWQWQKSLASQNHKPQQVCLGLGWQKEEKRDFGVNCSNGAGLWEKASAKHGRPWTEPFNSPDFPSTARCTAVGTWASCQIICKAWWYGLQADSFKNPFKAAKET